MRLFSANPRAKWSRMMSVLKKPQKQKGNVNSAVWFEMKFSGSVVLVFGGALKICAGL